MRSARARWLLLAALALAGCSDGAVAPFGGALNLNLTTPNTDDGAVLFTLSGASVDSVVPVNDQVFFARSDPRTLQVIVTGSLQNGTIARIYVPDIRLAGRYTASVQQVAARGSYLQRDAAPYSLTVIP
jgi:hypothetical protein